MSDVKLFCLALTLFAGAAPFYAADARAADDAEIQAFKGTWQIDGVTINGKDQGTFAIPNEITFFPKKGRFKCDDGTGVEGYTGAFTIDTSVEPHRLRMVFDGDDGADCRMIYKMDGDRLTIAVLGTFNVTAKMAKEPPNGFSNKKAKIITYERKK